MSPVFFLWNGVELGVVKYTKIDQRDQFFVTSYQFFCLSRCRDKRCGIAILHRGKYRDWAIGSR